MQRSIYRGARTFAPRKTIAHRAPQSLSIARATFYLYEHQRILLLQKSSGLPPILESFAPNEWAILKLLLSIYPLFVSYQDLLGCLSPLSSHLSSLPVIEDLPRLRNIVKVLRAKLACFPLGITSQRNGGYAITASEAQLCVRPPELP